jgi:thiol-disulfide isomerase/thioredoxin
MSAIPLIGDTWLGTGGRRISLDDVRGRIVLLDFWTLCCVNCHHVLAELRPIEEQFADVLTVIGVHSPKFEFEKNPSAVMSAMHRHGITHPVLNDPHLDTWRNYGVRAWPTLILLDTHGEVAGTFSGEGHGHAIAARVQELVKAGEADGSLVRGSDVFVQLDDVETPYVQPGKAIALRDGNLLISESGAHRLVLASITEPNTPLSVLGSGKRGLIDGTHPAFNEPYGLVELPEDIAVRVGYDIVIADTANHVLRGWNRADHSVRTIAGTGIQWMQGDATSGSATSVHLSTPWDIAWDGANIVIAMAGEHRMWLFSPVACTIEVLAGTTNEGLVDGPFSDAWFAQTSAVEVRGSDVFIIDAETSALRVLRDGHVHTLVGKGLFDFGHVDGPAHDALLQHPLGMTILPDGRILIADSYNGAIRAYDPDRAEVTTLVRDLAEPSDVLIDPRGEHMVIVESGAGRVSIAPIAQGSMIHGEAMRTSRPELVVHPGAVALTVVFEPPEGEKRDDRYGPSTHLVVSASPPELLVSGAGGGAELNRELIISGDVLNGVLHVAAKGASCDIPSAENPHPACHIHQQDWGIPIVVSRDGTNVVTLGLSG